MESLFSLNSIQDEFYQHERKNDEESKDESVSSVYGSQYLTEQDPSSYCDFEGFRNLSELPNSPPQTAWRYEGEWEIDMSFCNGKNRDGWLYGYVFNDLKESSDLTEFNVRKRRWVRKQVRNSEEASDENSKKTWVVAIGDITLSLLLPPSALYLDVKRMVEYSLPKLLSSSSQHQIEVEVVGFEGVDSLTTPLPTQSTPLSVHHFILNVSTSILSSSSLSPHQQLLLFGLYPSNLCDGKEGNIKMLKRALSDQEELNHFSDLQSIILNASADGGTTLMSSSSQNGGGSHDEVVLSSGVTHLWQHLLSTSESIRLIGRHQKTKTALFSSLEESIHVSLILSTCPVNLVVHPLSREEYFEGMMIHHPPDHPISLSINGEEISSFPHPNQQTEAVRDLFDIKQDVFDLDGDLVSHSHFQYQFPHQPFIQGLFTPVSIGVNSLSLSLSEDLLDDDVLVQNSKISELAKDIERLLHLSSNPQSSRLMAPPKSKSQHLLSFGKKLAFGALILGVGAASIAGGPITMALGGTSLLSAFTAKKLSESKERELCSLDITLLMSSGSNITISPSLQSGSRSEREHVYWRWIGLLKQTIEHGLTVYPQLRALNEIVRKCNFGIEHPDESNPKYGLIVEELEKKREKAEKQIQNLGCFGVLIENEMDVKFNEGSSTTPEICVLNGEEMEIVIKSIPSPKNPNELSVIKVIDISAIHLGCDFPPCHPYLLTLTIKSLEIDAHQQLDEDDFLISVRVSIGGKSHTSPSFRNSNAIMESEHTIPLSPEDVYQLNSSQPSPARLCVELLGGKKEKKMAVIGRSFTHIRHFITDESKEDGYNLTPTTLSLPIPLEYSSQLLHISILRSNFDISALLKSTYLSIELVNIHSEEIESTKRKTKVVDHEAKKEVVWNEEIIWDLNDDGIGCLEQFSHIRLRVKSGASKGLLSMISSSAPSPLLASTSDYAGFGLITISQLFDSEQEPFSIPISSYDEENPTVIGEIVLKVSIQTSHSSSLPKILSSPVSGILQTSASLTKPPLSRVDWPCKPFLKDPSSSDIPPHIQDGLLSSIEDLSLLSFTHNSFIFSPTSSSVGGRRSSAVNLMENTSLAPFCINEGNGLVRVEIFENQRWNLLSGGGWGGSKAHFLPADRSHFSDETGYESLDVDDVTSVIPLDGYEWANEENMEGYDGPKRFYEWKVDYRYTHCDDDGWSYGIDFWILSKNYRKGANCSSSTGSCVRRRKWTRLLKISTEYEKPRTTITSDSKETKEDEVATKNPKEESKLLTQSMRDMTTTQFPTFIQSLIALDTINDGTFNYEVFENQRYSPFLLNWGSKYPGHLLPTDRHRFTSQDGEIPIIGLEDIHPPPGCVWGVCDRESAPGWSVDSAYIKTDHEGWNYALDFWKFKDNMKTGHSLGKTWASVRRRKWVRPFRFLREDESEVGITGNWYQFLTNADRVVDDHQIDVSDEKEEAEEQSDGKKRDHVLFRSHDKLSSLTSMKFCELSRHGRLKIPFNQLSDLTTISQSTLLLTVTCHIKPSQRDLILMMDEETTLDEGEEERKEDSGGSGRSSFSSDNDDGTHIAREVDVCFIINCDSLGLQRLLIERFKMLPLRQILLSTLSQLTPSKVTEGGYPPVLTAELVNTVERLLNQYVSIHDELKNMTQSQPEDILEGKEEEEEDYVQEDEQEYEIVIKRGIKNRLLAYMFHFLKRIWEDPNVSPSSQFDDELEVESMFDQLLGKTTNLSDQNDSSSSSSSTIQDCVTISLEKIKILFIQFILANGFNVSLPQIIAHLTHIQNHHYQNLIENLDTYLEHLEKKSQSDVVDGQLFYRNRNIQASIAAMILDPAQSSLNTFSQEGLENLLGFFELEYIAPLSLQAFFEKSMVVEWYGRCVRRELKLWSEICLKFHTNSVTDQDSSFLTSSASRYATKYTTIAISDEEEKLGEVVKSQQGNQNIVYIFPWRLNDVHDGDKVPFSNLFSDFFQVIINIIDHESDVIISEVDLYISAKSAFSSFLNRVLKVVNQFTQTASVSDNCLFTISILNDIEKIIFEKLPYLLTVFKLPSHSPKHIELTEPFLEIGMELVTRLSSSILLEEHEYLDHSRDEIHRILGLSEETADYSQFWPSHIDCIELVCSELVGCLEPKNDHVFTKFMLKSFLQKGIEIMWGLILEKYFEMLSTVSPPRIITSSRLSGDLENFVNGISTCFNFWHIRDANLEETHKRVGIHLLESLVAILNENNPRGTILSLLTTYTLEKPNLKKFVQFANSIRSSAFEYYDIFEEDSKTSENTQNMSQAHPSLLSKVFKESNTKRGGRIPSQKSSTPNNKEPSNSQQKEEEEEEEEEEIIPFLHLTIIKGENLKSMNRQFFRPSSDPYIVASIDGVEKRTKFIKGTVNPQWNEELLFPSVIETSHIQVKLTLFDKEFLRNDQFMYEMEIYLANNEEKSIPLDQGTLTIKSVWK